MCGRQIVNCEKDVKSKVHTVAAKNCCDGTLTVKKFNNDNSGEFGAKS